VDELRAVFDDRRIVELRAPDPVALMKALDALPAVEKTSLFGTAVHAVLRDRALDPVRFAGELRRAGHAVESVEIVEPSLEDIFLDVVEKAAV
jgi:hypothetical protein